MNHEPVKTNLPFFAGLCLLGLLAIILSALAARPARAQTGPGLVDGAGFSEPTSDLAAYRQTRRVTSRAQLTPAFQIYRPAGWRKSSARNSAAF